MTRTPKYWLFKSEPEAYSIQDLAKERKQTTFWDGVRNYQARNLLRDEISVGDRVLFYHSSTIPPAIVGVARVMRAGYPDSTAMDPNSDHFDPKSTSDEPRWYMVDIQLERIFSKPVLLDSLRSVARLKNMELLRRGSRLSVQPVRRDEFQLIVKLAND